MIGNMIVNLAVGVAMITLTVAIHAFGIIQVTNDDTGEVTGGVTQLQTNKSWRRGMSVSQARPS